MSNVEKYFDIQKQNDEFIENFSQISDQIDIEWEFEKVKKYVEENYEKNIIITESEKL